MSESRYNFIHSRGTRFLFDKRETAPIFAARGSNSFARKTETETIDGMACDASATGSNVVSGRPGETGRALVIVERRTSACITVTRAHGIPFDIGEVDLARNRSLSRPFFQTQTVNSFHALTFERSPPESAQIQRRTNRVQLI